MTTNWYATGVANSSKEGQLIADAPLKPGELDKFGYLDIADNLTTLIKEAPNPFTFGLYGQWGVGKSTICKLIEKALEKNEEFKVFYFDTWKYERDSFRRQFLIELDKEVFNGRFNYKEVLNQSLTVPTTISFLKLLSKSLRESVRAAGVRLIISALFAVAALGMVSLILIGFGNLLLNDLAATFSEVVGAIFGLGALALLGKLILESLKLYKSEATTPRTDSAEGFEFYFSNALKELGKKKLLVIIDNLDRLDHSSAIVHLSDIKTFLANDKTIDGAANRTVFLIPCDNEALSSQLRQANKDLNTEEYLRKFFNVSIKIPRLLQLELDSYIAGQLEKTGIKEFYDDNYSLSFVISRAFKNNPREVIQFINSLTAWYLLAKRRNLQTVISKEGVPSLAKILAIRIKWPEIYALLENVVILSAITAREALEEIKGFDPELNQAIIECEAFLVAVDVVGGDEGEIFFSLKETDEQKLIPEWNAFISAAENREETTKEIFERIAKEGRLPALNSLLKAYVSRNRAKEVKNLNVLLSLSEVLKADTLKTFGPYLHDAFEAISAEALEDSTLHYLFLINPEFAEVDPAIRKRITKKISKVVDVASRREKSDGSQVDWDLDVWELVNEHKEYFANDEEDLVAAKQTYLSQLKLAQLFDASAPSELYPTESEKLANFVYSWYPQQQSLFGPTLFFSKSLLEQPSLHKTDILNPVLDKLADSLEHLKHRIVPTDVDPVRILTSQLLSIIGVGDDTTRVRILRVLTLLISPLNPQKDEIYARIGEYIEQRVNPPQDREEAIINAFGKEGLEKLINESKRIKDALVHRTSYRPNLFMSLKKDMKSFENPQVQTILINLISQNAEGFVELLKAVSYEIPEEVKPEVAINLIRNLNQSDPKIVEGFLLALKKLGLFPAQLPELLQAFRNAQGTSAEHKKLIKDFVKKNKKTFGDAQAEEFLED